MLPELQSMLLGIKWMEPEWLLDNFGGTLIWISLVIIFIECGLFFPFLPGDTLLFALGLFIAGQKIHVFGVDTPWIEMSMAIVFLTMAAFLGNVVGYEIGRKIGPPLYRRDGKILKRKYLDSTSAFFDKHGNKALVIGRFVPFVRTYITVVAGVTMMERRRFFTWSAIGAVLWVASISLLGYFLGRTFPSIGENIDYAMIAILIFTVAPVAYEGWKHRRGRHPKRTSAPTSTVEPSEPAEA